MTTSLEIRPESETQRVLSIIERLATDPAVDPAKLRELLSVKQSWKADEAREAFARDMARFQSECPIISKGDNANGKMYARIDRIHRETRALRKQCGFFFTWTSCTCDMEAGMATIQGFIGHMESHTMPLSYVIPLPDEIISGSGKKVQNDTQRAGSAMTYAKRYGECLALDIVTGEDDDGNGNRPKQSGPSVLRADTSEADALRRPLWDALVKAGAITGKERDWNAANQWLWRHEILDAAAEEAAPKLSAERFKKVIEMVKGKV